MDRRSGLTTATDDGNIRTADDKMSPVRFSLPSYTEDRTQGGHAIWDRAATFSPRRDSRLTLKQI